MLLGKIPFSLKMEWRSGYVKDGAAKSGMKIP